MLKMSKERRELIKDLNENTIIEQLEEVGKINIDSIDKDLGLLIEVLEEDFNIKTEIQNLISGQYLILLNAEELMRERIGN